MKKVTKYAAADGQDFDTPEDCLKYELRVAAQNLIGLTHSKAETLIENWEALKALFNEHEMNMANVETEKLKQVNGQADIFLNVDTSEFKPLPDYLSR